MAKPLSMELGGRDLRANEPLAVPLERCLALCELQLGNIVASAVPVGPPTMLVWHWLGSPKDPRGSVGLFCFGDRKSARTRLATCESGAASRTGKGLTVLRIDHVLGSRFDLALAETIHNLEHRGAVDVVNIPVADLARRRLLITTRGGEELAIALPREQRLFDGAVLLIDNNRAIVVRAATERWLRLEPRSIGDAIELGYHAGNLHWRVRFEGEVLFVALEGRPEDYTGRLGELISTHRVGVGVLDGEEGEGSHRREHPHADVPHEHRAKDDDLHHDHSH
jgi:urease accessory protein